MKGFLKALKGAINMRTRISTMIGVILTFVLAATSSASESDDAPPLKSLAYTIALSVKEYLEGQDVIVTSTIKNVSAEPVETLEPWAMAWTVTFDVQQERDGKQQSVLRPIGIPNGQGHWSRMIPLAPGEARTQSCETSYQLDGTLPPGEYVLKATYHPIKPGEDGYFTQVVPAKGVPFRVVPVEGPEQAWPALKEELVGMVDGEEADRRQAEKLLRTFIKDHPRSVFLPQAFHSLSAVKWNDDDYAGYANVLADWQKVAISEDERQHLLAIECETLGDDLGRYDDAIAKAKQGTSNECEFVPLTLDTRKAQKAAEAEAAAEAKKRPGN